MRRLRPTDPTASERASALELEALEEPHAAAPTAALGASHPDLDEDERLDPVDGERVEDDHHEHAGGDAHELGSTNDKVLRCALLKWHFEASHLKRLAQLAREFQERSRTKPAGMSLVQATISEAPSSIGRLRRPASELRPRASKARMGTPQKPMLDVQPDLAAALASLGLEHMAEALHKARVVTLASVKLYTPSQLRAELETVGLSGQPLHLFVQLCKHQQLAEPEFDPLDASQLGAGTVESEHASAGFKQLIGSLAGSVTAAPSHMHDELDGLPLVAAWLSQTHPSTGLVSQLVEQALRILGVSVDGSLETDLAAELLDSELEQRGLSAPALTPPSEGARGARTHMLRLKSASMQPSSFRSGSMQERPLGTERELERSSTAELVSSLGESLSQPPADGQEAMAQSATRNRLLSLAGDKKATAALQQMASHEVLNDAPRLASLLREYQSQHTVLAELLHQSKVIKFPTGDTLQRSEVSSQQLRQYAMQLQQVQHRAVAAIADAVRSWAPPALQLSGKLAALVRSVWFQMLVDGVNGSQKIGLKQVLNGSSSSALPSLGISEQLSSGLLLQLLPTIAAIQGYSNPADVDAQQTMARLGWLAGHDAARLRTGVDRILLPFLSQMATAQGEFEAGCRSLPTFSSIWEKTQLLLPVKRFIDRAEDADCGDDDVNSSQAIERRFLKMEERCKAAEAKAANAQAEAVKAKTRSQAPGKTITPTVQPTQTTQVGMLPQAEWEALSAEEKHTFSETRKAARKQRKAVAKAAKRAAAGGGEGGDGESDDDQPTA